MKALKSIPWTQGKRLLVAALAAALAIGSAASVMAADPITDDTVEAAMAAAKTPADHEAIAAYFTAKANEASANVEKHRRMSQLFGGKQKASWEAHCRALIKTFEEQARDYTALAKEQKAVAAALAK